MIAFSTPDGMSTTDAANPELLSKAVWIDLLNPLPEQVSAVENALHIRLPTRSQAKEIEVSSRLYLQDDALFMTATVVTGAYTARVETNPVTFVYQSARLITLRYAEPTPFATFTAKFQHHPATFATAEKVLIGLLDEIVNRLADILETVSDDLNSVSHVVLTGAGAASPNFGPSAKQTKVNYTLTLNQIGLNGERTASVRESLVSLQRVSRFIGEVSAGNATQPLDEHWHTIRMDILDLTDHATFLSDKVTFALDATLGRINNEQNMIIKLFSVLAVVLLPPTLIASIYGMNFENIPELSWQYGYPYALLMMLISAILPYLFFKRRGWL